MASAGRDAVTELRISVVVPTHNRAQRLGRTLAALEHQTLPRDAFEVIVVDDGSEPTQRENVRRYAPPYRYSLVEKSCGGLASARNAGAQRARAPIVLFLDDDVEPSTVTLEQHLESHAAAGQPVAVVGSLPYPRELQLTTFLWYLEQSGHFDLYCNPGKYPDGKPPMPPMNGNSSIPLDVFRSVGCYDDSFKRYGSEDLDLGYRLSRRGIPFVYNPHAVGFHHHLKSFDQFCVDQEAAGESLIELCRKHPEIRSSKKVDVIADRYSALSLKKKAMKAIFSAMLRAPWLLATPRAVVRAAGPVWMLRRPLFPLYRLIGHYHYGVGMQRGLVAGGAG